MVCLKKSILKHLFTICFLVSIKIYILFFELLRMSAIIENRLQSGYTSSLLGKMAGICDLRGGFGATSQCEGDYKKLYCT